MLAPMKNRPLAVAMPPPKFGAPVSGNSAGTGHGARPSRVPKGMRHFTSPLRRSTAVRLPQGVGLQGAPRKDSSGPRRAT